MQKPEDPIRIGDKEYEFDKLPPRAQKMIIYMQTIDQNLDALDTQMDMMQITRSGCFSQLTELMVIYDASAQETDPVGGLQENPDAA